MKTTKYLIVFGMLACVACKQENAANEAAVRQKVLDSIATVNAERERAAAINAAAQRNANTNNATTSNNSNSTINNTAPAKKKGMSNTTKGALIGTGAGIVGGAVTGAATSKDKGKGAVIGGVIGGAVGSGIGYGIGAKKDKKERDTIK